MGLTITVYGGCAGPHADTGGNKILVETGERTFFLDFGMGFGKAGHFFDEFLQPRSAVGLRDYLRLGLIPPLEGIYRDDLSAHEPDLWARYRAHPQYRRVEHLDGVLLSHAHQDHLSPDPSPCGRGGRQPVTASMGAAIFGYPKR